MIVNNDIVLNEYIKIVKDSWNSQIMNASQSLVKVDIGSKVKQLWDTYTK